MRISLADKWTIGSPKLFYCFNLWWLTPWISAIINPLHIFTNLFLNKGIIQFCTKNTTLDWQCELNFHKNVKVNERWFIHIFLWVVVVFLVRLPLTLPSFLGIQKAVVCEFCAFCQSINQSSNQNHWALLLGTERGSMQEIKMDSIWCLSQGGFWSRSTKTKP